MICYADMEHETLLQDPEWRAFHQTHHADVRRRLEELSGLPCRVRRYDQVTREWLVAEGVRALVISGNVTDWTDYDEGILHRWYRLIRDPPLPILGLCGGCQLIALAHGVPVGPMRRLEMGEGDPYDRFAPGYFKEWGFVPVRVVRPDPLFADLGEELVFLAAHYWEVKEVPPGFDLLASSDACRVQAIGRRDRAVYGTQFHPEAYVEEEGQSQLVNLVYPNGYSERQMDGRRLLLNFFHIVDFCDKVGG